MSYQNVGTPRFYIDLYQYLKAIGHIESVQNALCELNSTGPTGNNSYDKYVFGADRNDHLKTPFGLDPHYRKHATDSTELPGFDESVYNSYRFQFDKDPVFASLYQSHTKKHVLSIHDIGKHINYIAILGHNCGSINNQMPGGVWQEGMLVTPKIVSAHNPENSIGGGEYGYLSETGFVPDNYTEIVNFPRYNGTGSNVDWLTLQPSPVLDGFSIGTFTGGLASGIPTWGAPQWDGEYASWFHLNIGSNYLIHESNPVSFQNQKLSIPSISVGSFYDMPHAPNLSLTFKREYDGIDTVKTRGGSTLTNIRYTGPPDWKSRIAMPPWTNMHAENTFPDSPFNFDGVDNYTHKIRRSGRRIWDLSFDMIADSDIMAAYESVNTDIFDADPYLNAPDATGGGSTSDYSNPLLDDSNFYSQVLLKTLGGKLSFIFQPDNTNNSPDQFAICQIQKGSFSFRQKGFKLYNFKFTIEEVW